MHRSFSIAFALLILTSLSLADVKKAAEKTHRAEFEYQRHNIAGAEKLLREAIKEDPDSIDAHIMLGDLLSSTRRYSQATQEYGRVLEIDAKQKKLSNKDRHRAIDGQGVAYAQSGDLQRAKTIYLEALEKDPDYPFYNYNLACVYAELHDLDSALPYLKKAWDKRDNAPSDMKFPDPRQDDSFKPYLDNPKFQETVRNMVQ
jgi:tetratricopeptide (TPR) repeat protein